MGWLKIRQLYSLAIWRLEIQNQGVGRAVLSLKALEEGPLLPLSGLVVVCDS